MSTRAGELDSRLAYVEVLADERATTATAFLRRAITYYRRHGIHVERVITDNGSAYISTIPQTNGKAERFIRTMLNGWAYGAIYGSSPERTAALDGWLWHYNHRRRHSAIGNHPPISRTNVLGSYS
jgi:transposase InsO family protein